MNEKRKFQRHMCKIPVNFGFYEGDPDEPDIKLKKPVKGKGIIMDISKGGAYIISSSRVNIDMPIDLTFTADKEKNRIHGIIVRTGIIQNNPSEIAQRYAGEKVKGDAYIAVKFDSILENIPSL
jgi:hypothetical protein